MDMRYYRRKRSIAGNAVRGFNHLCKIQDRGYEVSTDDLQTAFDNACQALEDMVGDGELSANVQAYEAKQLANLVEAGSKRNLSPREAQEL